MSGAARANLKQLEASDPAATVWVNANAGSGKTHVLVDRVIRLMLDGTDPSRIMCLTFTKAAAAEMANRLFERLSKWITLDDADLAALLQELGAPEVKPSLLERARQLFTRALETPGGLRIQTIHAFCERVLQLFPVEAGVVPRFTMLDDREQADLLVRVRNSVLAEAKAGGDTALGSALLDIANRVQADAFDGIMRQLLKERGKFRDAFDPGGGQAMAEQMMRRHLGIAGSVTADSLLQGLALDAQSYRRFAAALEDGNDRDKARGLRIANCLRRDGATMLDLRWLYLTGEGEPRKRDIANAPVRKLHGWLDEFIPKEQAKLVAALGQLGDLECISATLSLLRLGSAIVTAFEAEKRRRGCYDFDDLIHRTAELLRERPDASWVLYKLDGGIDHLLVDEAQDTSPLQWKIIRTLTEEFYAGTGSHGAKRRTVFVVGDRKQSIYSFQGADPNVFEIVHDEFKTQIEGAGSDFRSVDLTVSFRSAPEILEAIDLVFGKQTIARRGLDGLIERDWHHQSNRRNARGTVEIWPSIKPVEKAEGDSWLAPVDREPADAPFRRLAQQIARTIKGWIGRRMLVPENRPVAAGDILILVRKRSAFFDAMIRALWNEQVPVAGADRLKLGENIAVLDLMALAQFCIMPEDDHALACILKSPLLRQPLSEDELLAIAAKRPGSLWDSLRNNAHEPFAAAAAELLPLLQRAPSARPFEFLAGVLMQSRARFIARLGSEANDAIDALLDLALNYEEAHGTSLAGFVNWFAAGEIEIKRNMEQGAGEVRIMTVHGAKGLEAPIVILPDTMGADAKLDPLLLLASGNGSAAVPLWPAPKLYQSPGLQALKRARQDEQAYEHRRLLYVAMTRARDELYICGYEGGGKLPEECWYNLVWNELKKHPKLCEGADPQCWRLGSGPVMVGAPADIAAGTAATALPDWLALASQASESPAGPAVLRHRALRSPQRVARGILIHRILQQLPELPPDEWPDHIARAVARAGAGTTLAAELQTLLAHPVLTGLLSADGLSEVPLMIDIPGQPPGRQRVDRLLLGDNGIVIADYKTDGDVPADISACNPDYLLQMARYRDTLRRIHPGVPVSVQLVWTEAPKLMAVPDDAMDRALFSFP